MRNGVMGMGLAHGAGRRALWAALLGTAAGVSLVIGWPISPTQTPAPPTAAPTPTPTPAQIVALRFPAELNATAPPRGIGNDLESRFFFSPNPSLDVARPSALSEQANAYADPSAEIGGKPRINRNAVFNDAQLANIRARLKLSAAQKQYWPAVEAALRAISWRRAGKNPRNASIDTGSPEVQRLIEVAEPLLKSLREDQKREVQSMARLMGLEGLALQL